MDLAFGGKRALVTGSSSGLGEAVARRLAAEGATVVVHGRNAERAMQVARGIAAKGGTAHVAIGDLATDDGAESVARAVRSAAGDIDILINNAGGFDSAGPPVNGFADLLSEHWERTLQNNLGSAARMIRHFVPGMRERGWGRVIQISSNLAIAPAGFRLDYEAAKAAAINLSVGLAKALRGSGVTANTVTPGAMRTPAFIAFLVNLAAQMGWTDEASFEHNFTSQLAPEMAGRIADPDEVAVAIAFIASPLAKAINGANLRVDGGLVPSVN